jgi:hypothetical protein
MRVTLRSAQRVGFASILLLTVIWARGHLHRIVPIWNVEDHQISHNRGPVAVSLRDQQATTIPIELGLSHVFSNQANQSPSKSVHNAETSPIPMSSNAKSTAPARADKVVVMGKVTAEDTTWVGELLPEYA